MPSWAGRERFVGITTATRRQASCMCYLEIEISRVPLFLPYSYPPPFCSNGRAQMLCCLSLCFSTYGESPARNNVPLGRKRCFGVVVSFAAIGGMGFGALIRWGFLHQRWVYKESILSRPRVVCTSWHLQYSPYLNILGACGTSIFINGSLVLQQGGQGALQTRCMAVLGAFPEARLERWIRMNSLDKQPESSPKGLKLNPHI